MSIAVLFNDFITLCSLSGRADDNEETIKKRLDTFHKHSKPVVEAYKEKCQCIPAERDPKDIFADVVAALDKL
jgi:adenylate kinase